MDETTPVRGARKIRFLTGNLEISIAGNGSPVKVFPMTFESTLTAFL
jgi:hypothetical protein